MDDANNQVNDGFIIADFVGGVLDGKTYSIPFVPEWRVAVLPSQNFKWLNKPPTELVDYHYAVYKYVRNGLYWLSRIEKR